MGKQLNDTGNRVGTGIRVLRAANDFDFIDVVQREAGQFAAPPGGLIGAPSTSTLRTRISAIQKNRSAPS